MIHISFDFHEGTLANMRRDPEAFTRALRRAAAIK
jgi:hypothetical protein